MCGDGWLCVAACGGARQAKRSDFMSVSLRPNLAKCVKPALSDDAGALLMKRVFATFVERVTQPGVRVP